MHVVWFGYPGCTPKVKYIHVHIRPTIHPGGT
jgi:hypothetical protein